MELNHADANNTNSRGNIVMNHEYIHFIIDPSGLAPKSLSEAILILRNASSEFCSCWLREARSDQVTGDISERAFAALDHIENELLRRRDDRQSDRAIFLGAALDKVVGQIIEPVDESTKLFFTNLESGSGKLPTAVMTKPLKLKTALTKIKHRDPNMINFSIGSDREHILYCLTNGGDRYPDTIIRMDIKTFCDACDAAAEVLQ